MLVFSLKRGESFYVGDQRVKLIDYDGSIAVLSTKGERFRCPNRPVKLPGQSAVKISAGARQESSIRVGIEAPLEVKILRERLYRRAHPAPSHESRPNRYHKRALGCATCSGTMKIKMHDGVWVDCPAAQDRTLPICDERG